jgi:transcriptional regulator with XRE-family HTH domain
MSDDAKKAGNRAVDPRLKKVRGERCRALRKALKLSQDAVALASGGDLLRTSVVHIEKGDTAIGSLQMIRGLARATGVPMDVLEGYIDGRIPLDEVIVLRSRIAREAPSVIDWLMRQSIPLD